MHSPYHIFHTSQKEIHQDLTDKVLFYKNSTYQKPIASHQKNALEQILNFVKNSHKPIIIDSGCGTGLSTKNLAERFFDHIIIGIDRSIHRLSKAETKTGKNFILVRGDFIDLWRLLAEQNLPISHHFMFYPNPSPKAAHLTRRFYAHPVFSTMLHLAPYFEMRTNWDIFAQECKLAFTLYGQQPELSIKSDSSYITLFEKKYLLAQCPIYVLKNKLR